MRWGSFVVVHRCRGEKGDVPVRRGLSLRGVAWPCPDALCVVLLRRQKSLKAPIFESAVSFVEKVFPRGGLLRMRGLGVAA